MKGVAIRDVNEETTRKEENIERVLRASEFLPLGCKGKIACSSNDPSYQNEALPLDNRKGVETFLDTVELDYLSCFRRELKAKIIGYTTRPYEIPREVLRYPCSLSLQF